MKNLSLVRIVLCVIGIAGMVGTVILAVLGLPLIARLIFDPQFSLSPHQKTLLCILGLSLGIWTVSVWIENGTRHSKGEAHPYWDSL